MRVHTDYRGVPYVASINKSMFSSLWGYFLHCE